MQPAQHQKTKILVGASKVKNDAQTPGTHAGVVDVPVSTLVPEKDSGLSTESLFSLCDSHYAKRKGIRKRRRTDNPNNDKRKDKRQSRRSSTDQPANTGPMVEIIDGKIVVKESSLLANSSRNPAMYEDYEEVEEENYPSSTYASFIKRRPSPMWGLEETRLFYTVLRQCGTEFTMMQAFFPGRTRKQLKSKYYREEKLHPELIDYALNSSLSLELAPFEAYMGKLNHNSSNTANTSSSSSSSSSSGDQSNTALNNTDTVGAVQINSNTNNTNNNIHGEEEVIVEEEEEDYREVLYEDDDEEYEEILEEHTEEEDPLYNNILQPLSSSNYSNNNNTTISNNKNTITTIHHNNYNTNNNNNNNNSNTVAAAAPADEDYFDV